MSFVAAIFVAVVWHFWLGLMLAVGSLLAVIAVGVGYLVKTQNPKYPRRQ